MADKTSNTLKLIGVLVALLLAVVSPIVSVAKVNAANSVQAKYTDEKANTAVLKADAAQKLAEKNARDFEYFKGEMTATMKGHKDGLDKMGERMDRMETKLDEMIKILVRFKRADDGE